jgi:hypothetical protein
MKRPGKYGVTRRAPVPQRSFAYGQNIRLNLRVLSTLIRHFGSLQKDRLITLERAAAVDAEYEFVHRHQQMQSSSA